MSKFKKYLSLATAIILMVCCFAIPQTATANTFSKTSFKDGSMVKCGKYYYAICSYNLVRFSADGKKLNKSVDSDVYSQLYVYKNNLYYQVYDSATRTYDTIKINGKSLKKTTVMNDTSDMLKGVYSKGFITKASSYYYIKNFKGITKKSIYAGDYTTTINYEYIGSTNKYIFFSKTVESYANSYSNNYTAYIVRYKAKNLSEKTLSKFGYFENLSYYPCCTDFHVYKKKIYFTFGGYEGSGAFYNGKAFKANPNGTKTKLIASNLMDDFIPGKNCVYLQGNENQNNSRGIKITAKGKISKVANSKIRYTVGKYDLTTVSVNNATNVNVVRCKNNGSGKKVVIKGANLVKSSDPSSTYTYATIVGTDGKYALVSYRIFTYSSVSNWRGETLRYEYFYVNMSNGKAKKIYTETY